MSRILFVDDDQNILRGLRDGLRRQRRTWTMTFVDGGGAALEFLRDNEVDVIVSDMRMPVMDGADLLDQVRILYPQMTRLVLSGHSQRDQLVRASAVAHQYLSKPCDGQALRDVLSRIFEARNRTTNVAAREMVGRLNGLPTVGAMHQEMMQCAVSCSDPSDAISVLLSRDADLRLRVGELVGQAFPEIAKSKLAGIDLIDWLGFEAVRGLSLASLVAADIERSGLTDSSDWLIHSARCARLARELTQQTDLKGPAFASGLLHDIGKIVHWLDDPQTYDGLRGSPPVSDEELCRREIALLGVDHAQTSGLLLESWGLNEIIARACAMHHGTKSSAAETPVETTAAAIADVIQRADHLLRPVHNRHLHEHTDWPIELVEVGRLWAQDCAMTVA